MRIPFVILFSTVITVGCSTNNNKHNYIKVLSIIKADSIDNYNKGFTLGDYFYYDLFTDSITIRIVQKKYPFEFSTYKGKLQNKSYADTILKLFNPIKTNDSDMAKVTKHCYQPNCYCNGYYAGYSDGVESKLLSSHEMNYDSLTSFIKYYYRLKDLSWDKKIVSDNEIDKTEEIVKTLKGLGVYDSVVKRYAPLPCPQGIKMEHLYGKWRTIGDENNDATLDYWAISIDKNGSWIMGKYITGKVTQRYSGKIISNIHDIIKVKSKDGLVILKILNLTENCLEFRLASHIWRLNRL